MGAERPVDILGPLKQVVLLVAASLRYIEMGIAYKRREPVWPVARLIAPVAEVDMVAEVEHGLAPANVDTDGGWYSPNTRPRLLLEVPRVQQRFPGEFRQQASVVYSVPTTMSHCAEACLCTVFSVHRVDFLLHIHDMAHVGGSHQIHTAVR